MPEKEARGRFYLVDRDGLLVDGMAGLQPFQAVFAQSRDRLADWTLRSPGRIDLIDVVTNARPTVLIGTSGQPHAFSEPIVRAMAANVDRPVIFPLSNPTERSEATPEDLLGWTQGRAIVGTGSPFPPVERDGRPFRVDQTNNAYVYPGVGLGAIAVKASRISDAMFLAAARTPRRPLARQARSAGQSAAAARRHAQAVVPRGDRRRRTSHRRRSRASPPGGDLAAAVQAKMWEPAYADVSAAAGGGARPITPQNEFKSDAGVMPPCGVHS